MVARKYRANCCSSRYSTHSEISCSMFLGGRLVPDLLLGFYLELTARRNGFEPKE